MGMDVSSELLKVQENVIEATVNEQSRILNVF